MTPLGAKLARRIAATGPLTIAEVMAAALGDPEYGYYATREPFGEAGDFITAPDISQMFGELVGLWLGSAWLAMGSPADAALVELGPGRGTLMADVLRALAKVPGFPPAPALHLVETSPRLKAVQRARLGDRVVHHDDIDGLPAAPLLLVANEFFDALPIRQWVWQDGAFHERVVGLDGGTLVFGLAPESAGSAMPGGPLPVDGAVLERSPAGEAIAAALGRRVARDGGVALIVDYGAAHDGYADTLQAVYKHRYADILGTLGEADITAQVNFAPLARAAAGQGAAVHGPVEQGRFLEMLGLGLRMAALARARPDQTAALAAARTRLTAPEQMGSLFKVLALSHPDLPRPAGL